MDLDAVKRRQRTAWAAGDYAAVGTRILLTSELLCESLDLRAGERVLDVACGSGNAALAAARRGCQVTGVDYVPALLDRAGQRANAEGLQVGFQEGDAEALPFGDDAFDVVVSTCGAMFAPDQHQAARELLRVCRPGGRIGMVNWTPDSYVGALFAAIGRHLPPPPGYPQRCCGAAWSGCGSCSAPRSPSPRRGAAFGGGSARPSSRSRSWPPPTGRR
jgi:SAM-dependent methyltransferase